MLTSDTETTKMEKIKAGQGYWKLDRHPIGGDFARATKEGLEVKGIELLERRYGGCNVIAYTLDGKKIAFEYSKFTMEKMA